MAEYLIQQETLASLADTIRYTIGPDFSSIMTPAEMNDELGNFGYGLSYAIDNYTAMLQAEENYEDKFLTRSEGSIYLMADALNIRGFAFTSCWVLSQVNFPYASIIGNDAFYSCTNLKKVIGPNITTIGSNAFQYCKNLSDISFPNTTIISTQAFANCSKLISINFPKVT